MGEPTKVRISDVSGTNTPTVEAQFNPTEYTLEKGAQIAEAHQHAEDR